MAITIQNYEWTLRGAGDFIAYNPASYPTVANDISIFVDGFGNNIEIPPFVSEDQFVVIENFGSTPGVLCQTNLVNNITYTTGTITSVGTAVTGIGTAFTADMLGGTITSNGGQVRNIVGFTNATSITVDVAFAPDIGVADTFSVSYGVGLTTTKPRTFTGGFVTSAATTVTGTLGATFTLDMVGGTITINGNTRNILARPTPNTLTIDVALTVAIATPNYIINYSTTEIDLTSWIPNGFVQIVVNTTGYYQDPQNTWQKGISGDAAPYPATLSDIPGSYELKPNIYILPEQTWDFRYTMMNDLSGYVANRAAYTPSLSTTIPNTTILAQCQVYYYLFDGPDSLICHQLLELGIPINVDNVEWYKKMLLKERGLDTDTWEHYLQVSMAYREREDKHEELYGRTRKG